MENRHVTTGENKWSRHGAVVTSNRIKNERRSPSTPSRFVSANEVIRSSMNPCFGPELSCERFFHKARKKVSKFNSINNQLVATI